MTSETSPVIYWMRRDLRLQDNPALVAACAEGHPVIPVFIHDPETEAVGAAARWRWAQGLEAIGAALADAGSRLVLRKGAAREVLLDLVAETGAGAVHWSRDYAPASVARDTKVKAALKDAGCVAESHAGFLLHEPWQIETGKGTPYAVYTPFWRAAAARDVAAPVAAPDRIPAPESWPDGDDLADWAMGAAMDRGADVVARFARVGEAAARARLDDFLEDRLAAYGRDRNRPDLPGTSGLSENLTYGEISPRVIWHNAHRALENGASGAEQFLKEIVWREFAWHLTWHNPDMATRCWRDEWESFPWEDGGEAAAAWRRGETGVDLVDAGMRELYATGTMHNRVRMVVASYLTKHMLVDWRVGLAWFAETLIDWDPASNAMGWQWVAGCGPDAAPYFRIFNPDTQAETHDPDGTYRAYWLTGGGDAAFRAAIPRDWNLNRPKSPVVGLKAGRERALAAYKSHRS